MKKACVNCGGSFEITDADLALLDKVSPVIGGKKYALPSPTLCFPCRLQRRLAFYNCRSLYKRKCDATGNTIVSICSPDKPIPVFSHDYWWSDAWDPMDYGRDVDFSRPFLEQVAELRDSVPQNALAVLEGNVNSDYTNDNYKTKNCYLVFDGQEAQDCYYGNTYVRVRDCMDFLGLIDCELCYEVSASVQCYNVKYSRYCGNCSDSWFLRNCGGCKHSFGCANLNHKEYHVFNEKKTKNEYEDFIAGFHSSKHREVQAMGKKVEAFFDTQPVKAIRGEKNENVVGDSLINCKNAYMCFESVGLEDCRYCTLCLMGAKDCGDVHIWGDRLELAYESCAIGENARNIIGGYYAGFGSDNLLYCIWCAKGSSHLFGCVNLRRKRYCILNKQYTMEEYEELAARIVHLMEEHGEWGEYFGPSLSAFGYNETKAQEYYPMTKEEVITKGWKWCDYESTIEASRSIPASKLPDDTAGVPDDILNWAIVCEVTGKPFKIIAKELEFYRDHHLPVPRRHPDQRHMDRMALRNPFVITKRPCTSCKKEIQTTFPPDHPYPIYCEECYYREIYE